MTNEQIERILTELVPLTLKMAGHVEDLITDTTGNYTQGRVAALRQEAALIRQHADALRIAFASSPDTAHLPLEGA